MDNIFWSAVAALLSVPLFFIVLFYLAAAAAIIYALAMWAYWVFNPPKK